MPEENRGADFLKIREVSKQLKEVLINYFGRKYVEIKEQTTDSTNGLSQDHAFDINIFKIERSKEPIYNQVNSESDLTRIKEEIKEFYKTKVVDQYWEFVDSVEGQVDEKTLESMEMIGKSLQNRQKKLESSFKKFKIEDNWDIGRTQKEFSIILKNFIKDILEATLLSITNGMKNSQLTVYDDAQKILNEFFQFVGVYTKEYKAGDKYSEDDLENLSIEISSDAELKDSSYKDVIRSVESLAYMFDEHFCVYEATVTVWRVS